MTSRLTHLRSQLAGLRKARARVRALAGYSALLIALLACLAAFFFLDLIFALAVGQRVVVIVLAAGAIGWSFWRFTRPLVRQRESEIDTALIVERHQHIDSDLVAALQFEPQTPGRGSLQLQRAVVDRVALMGRGIDVFAGFSRKQMTNRLRLLTACSAAAVLVTALWPGHMAALANRLFLGSRHYPTKTRIEQLIVNQQVALTADSGDPADSKSAQGGPVSFLVQCTGSLPEEATVQLRASNGGRTILNLKSLSLAERLARVKEAAQRISDALQSAAGETAPTWREEVATLIRMDAPAAVASLLAAQNHADLRAVQAAVNDAIASWPGDRGKSAVLAGRLERLHESLTYKLFAGDAWTSPAAIDMIPLPIIEVRAEPIPPAYARDHSVAKSDSTARQLVVLQGSSIDLELTCVNRKQLSAAWVTVQSAAVTQRFDLSPRSNDGLNWNLPRAAAALNNIRHELRYEIQVADTDGLSLETPIRGTIRVLPDREPTAHAALVHRVALPTAEPVVEYRASDDFGISRVALVAEVERGSPRTALTNTANAIQDDSVSQTGLTPAVAVPAEAYRFELLSPKQPLTGDSLPLAGSYPLALSPMKLAKGDRVKLTLEVADYRGENEQGQVAGVAYRANPLILEISDEAGVLAAISEADSKSEERLNEIIKRELGIGESP